MHLRGGCHQIQWARASIMMSNIPSMLCGNCYAARLAPLAAVLEGAVA